MPSLTFRRATPSDLPAILRLLADDDLGKSREILSDPPDARYLSAFAAIDADPNQLFLLATADPAGEILGCLQLTIIPGLSRLGATRAQIESVRVAPAHRNQGIGRQLMQHALAEARRRGCALAQLTTDKSRPAARRFYESLGFTASHEGMKRPCTE